MCRDWDRATQETASYGNYKKMESRADWWKMEGFSSDTIIKDPRMQLSIALHQAGLTQSKYGNQVLRSLEPPMKRPDQVTTFKFEYKSS
jgi:hypothetical protein